MYNNIFQSSNLSSYMPVIKMFQHPQIQQAFRTKGKLKHIRSVEYFTGSLKFKNTY